MFYLSLSLSFSPCPPSISSPAWTYTQLQSPWHRFPSVPLLAARSTVYQPVSLLLLLLMLLSTGWRLPLPLTVQLHRVEVCVIGEAGKGTFIERPEPFLGLHRFTCCAPIVNARPGRRLAAFICFSGCCAHSASPFRGPLCSRPAWPSTPPPPPTSGKRASRPYFFLDAEPTHPGLSAGLAAARLRPATRFRFGFDALMKKVAN